MSGAIWLRLPCRATLRPEDSSTGDGAAAAARDCGPRGSQAGPVVWVWPLALQDDRDAGAAQVRDEAAGERRRVIRRTRPGGVHVRAGAVDAKRTGHRAGISLVPLAVH